MAITAREAHSFDPREPFSRADARAAGIGLKTLLSSRFRKIFYDCYISSTVPLTTKIRANAALGISPPGSFLSHPRLPEYGAGSSRTRQMFTSRARKAGRTSRQGVKAHAAVEGTAVTSFRNLPITTPEQTFSDLATSLDLVALVVLGDGLVKSGRKCRSPSGAVLHNDPSKQLRAGLIDACAAKRPRSAKHPFPRNDPRSGTIPATDYGCGQSRSSGN